MKLRIKDKIFLVILAAGLVIFLYDKITGGDKKELPAENIAQSVENKTENSLVSGNDNNLRQAEIGLGDEKIKIQIADTDAKRYQGLSDVENMGQDEGMLFIHSEPGFYGYVMRRIKFDLDFVFMQGDEIVDIKENISKDFTGTISGNKAYDKVLELNAGTVERAGILIGEKVKI